MAATSGWQREAVVKAVEPDRFAWNGGYNFCAWWITVTDQTLRNAMGLTNRLGERPSSLNEKRASEGFSGRACLTPTGLGARQRAFDRATSVDGDGMYEVECEIRPLGTSRLRTVHRRRVIGHWPVTSKNLAELASRGNASTRAAYARQTQRNSRYSGTVSRDQLNQRGPRQDTIHLVKEVAFAVRLRDRFSPRSTCFMASTGATQ